MDHFTPSWAVGLVVYILAGRLAMRWLRGTLREAVMALLNLAAVLHFLHDFDFRRIYELSYNLRFFTYYVMIVVFQYFVLALCTDLKGWPRWPAFFAPLAVLIVYRYVPGQVFTALGRAFGSEAIGRPTMVAGMSYLAFRCSRLAFEVQNGSVKRPGLCQYLNFAFFLPTMAVGPINTYANFQRGFEAAPWEVPVGRAALRVLVGLIKFAFLSSLCSQLAYAGLLRNGHFHPWIHLPIAMVFYYLYLYCNFSGFCDMAIGAAALIGIPVPENFDNPFAARNLKDFWNRWHITLSQWMRDIVFAPLAKFLVRLTGPAMANHAIALAILVVFLLVGLWHGLGWNFAIYGLLHGLGLVVNHYYTLALKKWLGREGFKAYNENRWIHAAAVGLTFACCAASLMFFANTLPEIKEIFRILR